MDHGGVLLYLLIFFPLLLHIEVIASCSSFSVSRLFFRFLPMTIMKEVDWSRGHVDFTGLKIPRNSASFCSWGCEKIQKRKDWRDRKGKIRELCFFWCNSEHNRLNNQLISSDADCKRSLGSASKNHNKQCSFKIVTSIGGHLRFLGKCLIHNLQQMCFTYRSRSRFSKNQERFAHVWQAIMHCRETPTFL